EVLAKKGILRDRCHFIGNIQSRKIGEIGEFCSVIHSLDSLSHARKFMKAGDFTSFFIQINLDPTKSSGVDPQLIPEFLKIIPEDRVLGISAIGKGDFTIPEKINEFKELKKIRDTYLPGKKISAGTSRDFEIALSEGIEIVRVGQALFN
ncbi:MAG: hypothetical protein OEL87_03775, partial [Nanoarchaeota archaeon]|nr:hypothetical protein [Nanoarchaeota archaeon]